MDALWNFLIDVLQRSFWFWRVIQPDEGGVRTFCGKNPVVLGPGLHFVWPIVGDISVTVCTEAVIDVRGQSLTTKDQVMVCVGLSVAYEVLDAYRAIYKVQDRDESLANESLRCVDEYVNAHTLAECLDAAPMTAAVTKAMRDVVTQRWGVKIHRIGRSDFGKHRAIRLINQ